jgi:hypothetical protein
MALVLFLLAAALMLSGAAAMFSGSDIIMVERGWAMVIAGATGFSGGAVLLGIAALLRTLERVTQDVKAGRSGITAEAPVAPPRTEPRAREAAPVFQPGTADAEPAVQPNASRHDLAPPNSAGAEPIEVARPAEIREERAPDLRAERLAEAPQPRSQPEARPNGAHPSGQSEILVAPDPPRIRLVEPEPASRLELAPAAEPMRASEPMPPPEPLRAVEPPPPREPEVTVVGKYSSGGNSYVMFSDGSIQADTPSGRHRFASLDELKVFVASGGERV